MPRDLRGRNRGRFKPGFDPRRHVFTRDECSRGGMTTARRYLCGGRWHLDWYDRCDRRVRNDEGDYEDVETEEEDGHRGERERANWPAPEADRQRPRGETARGQDPRENQRAQARRLLEVPRQKGTNVQVALWPNQITLASGEEIEVLSMTI